MKKSIILTLIIAILAVLAIGLGVSAATEPEINIRYGNITRSGGYVSLGYAVEYTGIPSTAEHGLLVWRATPDSHYLKGREDELIISDNRISIDGKGYYKFTVTDIAEMEITDDVYTVAYARVGTKIYYSEVNKHSPLRYAYIAEGKIGDDPVNDEQVLAFLANMIKKGADAQRSENYKTDRLADADYVELEIEGGLFADGTEKGLYIPDTEVAVKATESASELIADWLDSEGSSVAVGTSLIKVPAQGGKISASFVKAGCSIEYDLCAADAKFDEAPATAYTPGEAFRFPIPTREGYSFGGWYTDPSYDLSSAVRGVPAGHKGNVKVYAAWSKELVHDDYSKLDGIDLGVGKETQHTTANKTVFRANNNDGSSFVSDGRGIVWSTGAKGSDILVSPSGGLAGILQGGNTVTVRVSVSLEGGKSPAPSQLRFRVVYKTELLSLLNVAADGSVYLGGDKQYKITELTDELQYITVCVDFERAEISAISEDGLLIATRELLVPEGSKFTNLVDWKNDATKHALNWSAGGRSSENAMRIGEISIYSGIYGLKSTNIELYIDELAERLEAIREENDAFGRERFLSPYSPTKLSSTTSMHNLVYETVPELYERDGGTGARLMLNSSMIEGILATFESEHGKDVYAELIALADSDIDGKLGEPELNFNGRSGLHNYDTYVLAAIEAKALMFRLLYEQNPEEGSLDAYRRDFYGYSAILGIKNFLETMQIEYISSDQCREFGYAMFIAAEVYDWCYPILSFDDRAEIRFAVVARCCTGTSAVTDSSLVSYNGVKMEVGFPPTGQGAVADHGAEAQILRDYLAFALAIYDEDTSWWRFVAGRIMEQYVPMRNYYFQSGITQQGVSLYAHHRHYSDLYSAWIIQTATGNNPYVGMENTVKSIISSVNPSEEAFFASGDGGIETLVSARLPNNALIASAIFNDDTLYTWSYEVNDGLVPGYGTTTLTPANMIIFASQGMECTEDKYKELSPTMYNGHPLGQIVTRYRWNDPDAAATHMKIGLRTTAGHEHQDAGTFQIYYKGLLTSSAGLYNNSRHEQTKYYHRATIAHNGILVFNPSKWDYTSTDPAVKWYSGGQRSLSTPRFLEKWLAETYDTGTLMGAQYGYKDEESRISDYAYIAGNIAKAYESDTVAYMTRSMLTVYNDPESDFPMYFFVFDSVESTDPSYKKTFLLHIRGEAEPSVDGNVITTANGGGKLVMHSLTDGATIEKVGGIVYGANGKYDALASSNFLINGYRIVAKNTSSDGNWGRIEVSLSGELRSTFMHAMYVTDRETTNAPTVTKISAEGIEGAVIGDVAAVFRDSDKRTAERITFSASGEGELRYFVAGLESGSWSITVGGESYGTVTSGDGGMAVFTVPAGEVIMTKTA